MQPNIVLPIDKANGTHLATRYINVHLPHIGVGYIDDALIGVGYTDLSPILLVSGSPDSLATY